MSSEANNNIALLRSTRGLTQAELGRQIGVCAATVSRWELGKAAPNLDQIQKIASVLGLPASAMLKGSHDLRGSLITLLKDNARLHRENADLQEQITRLHARMPEPNLLGRGRLSA
jgi:transcriptional regulator with XRE-family HTH domain